MSEQIDAWPEELRRKGGRAKGYVSEKRKYGGRTKTARVPEHWDIEAMYYAGEELRQVLALWQQLCTEHYGPRWQRAKQLLDQVEVITRPFRPADLEGTQGPPNVSGEPNTTIPK